MRGYISLIGSLLLWLVHFDSAAQTIQGQITDRAGNVPVDDVAVVNLHTEGGILSDAAGKFTLAATQGQLIEFPRQGITSSASGCRTVRSRPTLKW